MKKKVLRGVVGALLLLSASVVEAKGKKRYDYIIVGGGTAGCILARKLSDDCHKSVLVLEAGGSYLTEELILNPSLSHWFENFNEFAFDPKYAITYSLPAANLSGNYYSEGRQLGGGAAHNALIGVRGTPSIYNAWEAATGNTGNWDYYGNILPLMKNLESYYPNGTIPNPAERGFDGPIGMTQGDITDSTNSFLNQFSIATNTPFVSDYNDPSLGDIGISAVQTTVTPGVNGHRSFSALEFLAPVIDSHGRGLHGRKLTVVTNAKALNIRINDDMRATSVHYATYDVHGSDSDPKILKASLTKDCGKLILCAGSIQTPALLMRSGVGPASDLHDAGIPVILNSPQVGQNLQNQYGSSALMVGSVPEGSSMYLDGYLVSDPLSIPNDGVRRLQGLNFSPAPGVFVSLLALLNPKTVGSLKVTTNNPYFEPLINYVPFSDGPVTTVGTDAYMQVRYYRMIQEAASAAGIPVLLPTPADFASDDLLLAYAQSHIVLQSHIVGTARMGDSINDGVVDANLKVFGLDNVYIGDNSVQRVIADGNTGYPAYIIGLVLSQVLGAPTPPIL